MNKIFTTQYLVMLKNYAQAVVTATATILFTLIALTSGFAEGIKQVAPASTDVVLLMTNNANYGNFAGYSSTVDSRLHINIKNPSSEQVHMGFSQMVANSTDASSLTTTYYVRIKDPLGNIVYGPQAINNTNANANTWALATAGPSTVVGASGYTPFTYTPAAGAPAGDYYIEFSDNATSTSSAEVPIKYWDITVATRATPTAINGRVWSKQWAFRTPAVNGTTSNPTYGEYDRPFNGSIHTYSDEIF
jgi:hypothetical protein